MSDGLGCLIISTWRVFDYLHMEGFQILFLRKESHTRYAYLVPCVKFGLPIDNKKSTNAISWSTIIHNSCNSYVKPNTRKHL